MAESAPWRGRAPICPLELLRDPGRVWSPSPRQPWRRAQCSGLGKLRVPWVDGCNLAWPYHHNTGEPFQRHVSTNPSCVRSPVWFLRFSGAWWLGSLLQTVPRRRSGVVDDGQRGRKSVTCLLQNYLGKRVFCFGCF